MKTRALVGMAVAMVLLEGCETRLNTRSGGPEVTIKGVPIDTVRTAYAHELAEEGFAVQLTKAGDVIGLKDSGVVSQYDEKTGSGGGRAKVRLNFLQGDDGVRVLYHGFIGGEEARGDWKDRQAKLERVAEKLEAVR